jgi:hypothetical protein
MTSVNINTLISYFKNKSPGTKNYKIYGFKSIGQLYTSTLEDTYKTIEKKRKRVGIKICINVLSQYKFKNIIDKIKFNMNE